MNNDNVNAYYGVSLKDYSLAQLKVDHHFVKGDIAYRQKYGLRTPDGQAAKSIGVLRRDSSHDTGDSGNGRWCQIPNSYASTVCNTIKKIVQIIN